MAKEEVVNGRRIVIPGESITSGEDLLPGDGTRKEGKEIIAIRYGLAEESGRLVKVIPLSGIYNPRNGNVVIGKVEDITFNGWIITIDAPYSSFLPVAECPRFINKNDLADYIGIGDAVAAKVTSVKTKGIDLTVKGRGLGKLEGGMLIHINPNKVPRVIGKEGSMINLIKEKTNCHIVVGQNGFIWVKGNNVHDELFAKDAILFVSDKSFVDGLTDKTKEWLEKNSKEKK